MSKLLIKHANRLEADLQWRGRVLDGALQAPLLKVLYKHLLEELLVAFLVTDEVNVKQVEGIAFPLSRGDRDAENSFVYVMEADQASTPQEGHLDEALDQARCPTSYLDLRLESSAHVGQVVAYLRGHLRFLHDG